MVKSARMSGGLFVSIAIALLASACASRRPPKAVPPPPSLQTAIAVDKDGSNLLVGTFAGTAQIAGATLQSAGGTDIFVVKTKPDGAVAWAQRFGGRLDDAGTSVAVDPDGNIVIGGTFQGELVFGTERLAPQFRSPELRAIFVAKLDPSGKPLWARQIAVSDSPAQVSVAIRPDKSIIAGAGLHGRIQTTPTDARQPTMKAAAPAAPGAAPAAPAPGAAPAAPAPGTAPAAPAHGGLQQALSGESVALAILGPNGQPGGSPPFQALSTSAPCSHSPCQTGATLNPLCDWCVGSICSVDSYCCNTWWDSICVGEVWSVCGQRCDCGALCTVGNPFNAFACPPCTSNVCSVDPYCCRVQWDSICVGELLTYCGKTCP
jgi:hypothetical protein